MKKMRFPQQIANWIPVIIAACSIASVVGLFQIDSLVNQTLYGYGLQFSGNWATPYWNTIRTVFALTWLVVATSIGLQIYNVTQKNSQKSPQMEPTTMPEEKHWYTYKLGDGATIKVKLVLKSAKRLKEFMPDGTPMYAVITDNIVQVLDAPKELKARPLQMITRKARKGLHN